MLKVGKFAIAAILCLVLTMVLLTTGAFAQSANHAAVVQAAHTAVSAHASWWWGGWGWRFPFWGWGGWGGWGGWWGGCGCW